LALILLVREQAKQKIQGRAIMKGPLVFEVVAFFEGGGGVGGKD
jgi:hypothetical protein